MLLIMLIGILIGLIIGYLNLENAKYSGGQPFVVEILLTVTALLPIMHLTRYKNAKISKYAWGFIAGIIGVILSLLVFIVFALFSTIPISYAINSGNADVIIGVISTSFTGAVTAAFYWFFISLAEEIYRIKFEEAGNSNPKSKS